nr:MAG TPA: hypothetical protein [Caudoviricetes sp.]
MAVTGILFYLQTQTKSFHSVRFRTPPFKQLFT